MKTLFLAFCLSGLFLLPAFAQDAAVPDIKVVEGDGLSTTEQDALTQAKRDAVEKGIGVMLTSQTETKNFMVEKDIVITKTMGSVKKYDVLSKGKTPDGLFEVKIRAEVSLANIKADLAALKILLESMDKPRVMVLIQESRKKEIQPTYTAASSAIIDFLTQKEFNLIDPAQVAAMLGKGDDDIARAAKGDPVAAAKLGKENGAEVILVGNATASVGEGSAMMANMKSGQADVDVKVINCQNGKIIASKTAHGAMAHISEETAMNNALIKAANKLMDRELFEKIVASWQDMANNGQDLKVTVSGVTTFAQLKDIKTFISTASPNVVKVTQRDWKKDTGALELDVLFKGSSESFGEYMDGKKTAGGLTVSVADFSSGKVKLAAK